jgi:two-component system cell cycle sensor histidine kinase/response regulator CckA
MTPSEPTPSPVDPVLRTVFDGMFEGVQIIDFEWRYVYLNQTAAAHGRRSREELVGRTMTEVYPGIEGTEMFRTLEHCMKERSPQQFLNQFTYPDGHSAWFDLRIDPVPLGILVLSIDVSAQKAAEEALRNSREDLAATLDCMADGVITTDVEGRVTRMNPAAAELTGWPESEGKGRLLDELVHFLNQRTGEAVDYAVDRVLRQGLKVGLANDTVLVARDGSRIPIASSGAPIRDPDGSIRGVVLALRNMTTEYELASMLQQAQKMEAVGRLAGGVAHDFNNLLTVISGYSNLILDEMAQGEKYREEIQEISDAGQRAAALTRQLLAFSRKQVLRPEVLDLNQVVSGMDKMMRRLIGEDVDLVTRLTTPLGLVTCDPGQIEQIIMNLVVNARDAMPQGGKLTIETGNVELDEEYARGHTGARSGPHVMIAITDTGTGMDAATRARIFEPFFTTKGPAKGTGLGLATVFGIVQQSGGNIWVYSEPGRGTTFKVYLPSSDGVATLSRPRPRRSKQVRAGLTVLVVEDDVAVRGLIRRALESAGYRVLDTGDAAEAIRIAATHGDPIHLLLTDVVLPNMGGRALADQILAAHPRLKVVYMSGYTDDAIVHQGVLERGAAFIEKPIISSTLVAKLQEFVA